MGYYWGLYRLEKSPFCPKCFEDVQAVGIYQENNSNLTYSGNWTSIDTSLALGNSRIYTNDPNGTVSFKINNSVGQVTISSTGYLSGAFQISVDNSPIPFATIKNGVTYGLGTGSSIPVSLFNFTVTPGDHIVTLKNISSTYSEVDQIVLKAPAVSLILGTYQENNENLTYTGNWADAEMLGSPLLDSRRYTNDPNATMTFKTDNSVRQVTIYRTTYLAGVYGSMQVFLDGASTPFTTINNTSSDFLYKQQFTFTLPTGGHTITLKNVGATYSDIDQIVLDGDPAPLGLGSYQETDRNLIYSGSWVSYGGNGPLGGSFKYTTDPNGRLTFFVDQTVGRIVFYRTTYLAGLYGKTRIYVEGRLVGTMDNTSTSMTFGAAYTIGIPFGKQKIELESVDGNYTNIDQIDLLPPPPILTTGISASATIQENDLSLSYSGKWTTSNSPDALQGARKYTNDPKASVKFSVDGTVGSVTVYRSTYLPGVYGSMQVFIDGATTPQFTIDNTSSTFLYAQPFIFPLPFGNHSIELRNVGSTYSDIDQITVTFFPSIMTGGNDYQESNLNLSYTGTWLSTHKGGPFVDERMYTKDPNGSVSFKINYTVGRVTLYRTTYLPGVYGSMHVFIDGATMPSYTINNTSSTLLYDQPFSFAVTPGDHTITFKNVGTTYSDIDHIALYAPPEPFSAREQPYQEWSLGYFSGKWSIDNTPSAFEGSRRYTNDPNADLTFTIDNSVSLVTVHRTTYLPGIYGSMQVFLDDSPTPLTTINNTSSTLLYRQQFTFAIPTPGNHTLKFKNVGSTYSDIDQIKLSYAPPLSVGMYQEDYLYLTYFGEWTQNYKLDGWSNVTHDPDASVTFTIDNSVGSVTIYHSTFTSQYVSAYGALQVFLDSSPTPLTTINNANSSLPSPQPFTFSVHPGNHIITLKNVGTAYSDIDQISLQPPAAPLSVGSYEETDSTLIYTGSWIPATTSSAHGGSRIYTNDPNGTVSFKVDSSVGRVTIYRTTYSAGVYGSFQVFVDGVLLTTMNNTSAAFLFQQPFSFTLAPGPHTITLKNVGTTFSDLDQITLQAAS